MPLFMFDRPSSEKVGENLEQHHLITNATVEGVV